MTLSSPRMPALRSLTSPRARSLVRRLLPVAFIALMLVVALPHVAHAQFQQMDGQQFGGNYWGDDLQNIAKTLCPYLDDIRMVVVAACMTLSLVAFFQAAQGRRERWKSMAVLIIVGALVFRPGVIFGTLGSSALNNSYTMWMSCPTVAH